MTVAVHTASRPLGSAALLRPRAPTADDASGGNAGEGSIATVAARADDTPVAPLRPWLAPAARQGHPAESDAAPASGADPALEAVVSEVQGNLAALARDPEAFHAALSQAFGERHDRGAAEDIRRRTLAGDFSWMPEIRVVDEATLQDSSGTQGAGRALGAYDAAGDVIYVSRELVDTDPGKAVAILTEEVGHGLDARLNTSDAAGDEGNIFARAVDGEDISAEELAVLRAENDSGTIVVDGKEIEVEFFIKKLVKGVGKAFKSVGKAIAGAVKGVANAVVGGFEALMSSELLGTIMNIAQFIPIPVVQLVARGYNLAKAAYSVYQGVRHGSMAMVLGGAASVFGGVGRMGSMLGASSRFVGAMETAARYTSVASRGYSALAKGDLRSALSFGAEAFGASPAAPFLRAADTALAARDAARGGDVFGAIVLGSNAMAQLPGTRHDAMPGRIGNHALNARALVGMAEGGDYVGALGMINDAYGSALGLDAGTRAGIDRFVATFSSVQAAIGLADTRGDYAGAARMLFGEAAANVTDPATKARLEAAAQTFARMGEIVADMDAGRLSDASAGALSLLGEPLDASTRERVTSLLQRIEAAGGPRPREAVTP